MRHPIQSETLMREKQMRKNKHILSARVGLGALAMAIATASGGSTAAARRSDAPSRVSDGGAPTAALGIEEARLLDAYAKLPVSFVENRGQMDSRVRYYAQGNRYAFYLTRNEVLLSFMKEPSTPELSLALRFIHRNPNSVLEGGERASGEVNYFRGADAAQWHTEIPRYRQAVYRELWQGVDLRLHEESGVLKYEFRVRPGGRPEDIRLAYAGAEGLTVDGSGALLIKTAIGVLRDSAPVSYQDIDGMRVPVESQYVLDSGEKGRFAFAVGAGYRRDRDLIIDPGVAYTTFLGGNSHEDGAGIAVDAAGNAYVTGATQSPDFPTTVGAFRRTGAANNFTDVFVTKLNATGTALVYSTFIGGSDLDFGRRIAIDAAGNAYVTGQTKSSNFPTTANAFDRTLNIPPNCPRCAADNTDTFVAKLNASGSGLVYSTYLGGTDFDSAHGIAVDSAGNAYVIGETVSIDFPTTAGALSRTNHGQYDVYVTKLNATGSALVYSTYLGGTLVDNGERVAVDSGGNVYVLGFSSSPDFPTTPGAFDTTANGAFDVTLTKLNPTGSALVYSTFLGGQDFDSVGGLALDAAGNAYIVGGTASLDFPTTPGAFDTLPDGNDAFLTKLSASGSTLVFSTVFGGNASDGATGVGVDAAGNIWVTGVTSSANFPMTVGAADSSFNGVADAFIAQFNPTGSTLVYSTFLGGTQSDVGNDLALDSSGNVYVTGHTFSMDFPATTGAFDTVFNGDPSIFWGDAFVTKIQADAGTSTPPAPPAVPAAPTLLAPANADTPPQPITFDWNDVASAASYTIQIDDSSAFSVPLVREASVTASTYATSNLATVTHFWRVRGVNSAGTAGPWSAVRSFTPQAAPPPATLSTMSTNPSTVVGGNGSSVTVVLSVGAPFGGAVVAMSSSNPAVASLASSVTIPENGFTGTLPISTTAVSANTTVTITASYNNTTRTATLVVTPPAAPPPPATLQSLAVNPASVAGGSGAQGTVTLTSGAPSAGAAVSLASSNANVAVVPASLTVAAGATSATFTISTTSVTASTPVTISATYSGTTQTASLTVTPPAPPPQTAALTVNATGRSGERITSSPAGISVATGTSGSASFTIGTAITLTVSNGRDAIWSGACSSGGAKATSCTFTLNAAATVTANVQ